MCDKQSHLPILAQINPNRPYQITVIVWPNSFNKHDAFNDLRTILFLVGLTFVNDNLFSLDWELTLKNLQLSNRTSFQELTIWDVLYDSVSNVNFQSSCFNERISNQAFAFNNYTHVIVRLCLYVNNHTTRMYSYIVSFTNIVLHKTLNQTVRCSNPSLPKWTIHFLQLG